MQARAASARPGDGALPVGVVVVALLCSVGFLLSLMLDESGQARLVERWGLVPREVLRAFRGGDALRSWTPLTAVLLHENVLHLCANLFYLVLFGEAVERSLGPWRFALLFGLSALAAGWSQVAAVPASYLPALGASGAVSGLLGAYLVVRRSTPVPLRWHPLGVSPLVFLGLWGVLVLATGLHAPQGFAIWAHLGGFVAGMTAGIVLRGLPAPRDVHAGP